MFRYRYLFKPSKVRFLLMFVSCLALIVFVGLSFPIFIERTSNEYHVEMVNEFRIKYLLFVLWYPVHLILVLIVTIVLIFVYRKIAQALGESFWAPLTGPIFNNYRSIRNVGEITGKKGKVTIKETDVSDTIELTATRNKPSANFLTVSQGKVRSASVCSVESDFGHFSEAGSQVSLKDEYYKKRKNNQRKINSAFFFVSFFFIIIAIPTTTMIIFSFIKVMNGEADYTVYGFFVSQILYGLVFLLNPFMYMFSNQFIMQKFQSSRPKVQSGAGKIQKSRINNCCVL